MRTDERPAHLVLTGSIRRVHEDGKPGRPEETGLGQIQNQRANLAQLLIDTVTQCGRGYDIYFAGHMDNHKSGP